MHITILALGSRGDVQPYAALGTGLRLAGYEVRFVTFESFAPLITENGLDFHPIKGDAQALVAGAGANMVSLVRTFSKLAAGYAHDLSDPRLKDTDAIINQLPGGLYGYDLAEKFGVPMILASVIPLARTRTFPMMGFPRLSFQNYNRLTYSMAEQMMWSIYRPIINRWRKSALDLPSLSRRGYFSRIGTARLPIINGFSAHIVPRPIDWSEHIHITGYWFSGDETWQPPAELQRFIEAGSPPVFIGFGSMPVKKPDRTFQTIVDALKRSGQRGILHSGWGNIGNTALPDSLYKIDYAPYAWLFPRMALVVHHGGSGTTAFGLRAGVPSMVVPFVFDQFYWGQRLADLGVGPQPIPYKHLTADRLAQAITQAIDDPHMHRRAAELGDKLRAEKGIQNAIEVIRRYTSDNLASNRE